MNKSNKVHPASLLLINFLQFSIIFGSTALTEVCKEEGAKLYHEFGNRVTCSYYLDPLDTTSIVEKTKYWDRNKTKIMSIIKYSNGGKQFSYNRFNPSGILDISATYKNGLLEGKLTSFYSNGKKEYNQMYKNGIKNGIYTKYYKNGRMAIRGSYKNHQRIGRWIEYYNDGVVKNKTNYLNESNGANLNPSVSYNQDGTVKRTVKKLKNGDIESISYSRSGNVQYRTLYRGRLAYEKYEYDQFSGLLTDSFVRDLESGLVNYKKYYDNGQAQESGQFNYRNKHLGLSKIGRLWDRTGTWRTYYRNGEIMSTEDWSDEKKEKRRQKMQRQHSPKSVNSNPNKDDGPYTITRGEVVIEEGSYFNRMKTGENRRYNNEGKMIEMSFYKEGKVHGSKKTYKWDGSIIELEESYRDGVRQGPCFRYAEGTDGVYLRRSCSYINGQLDGKSINYNQNGLVWKEEEFVEGKAHGKIVEYFQDLDELKIRSIGQYSSGMPSGELKMYDKQGNLTDHWIYNDKGQATGDAIERHNNWSSAPCGTEGDWHGLKVWESRGTYLNGKKQGMWKSYLLPNMTLHSISKYNNEGEKIAFTSYQENGKVGWEFNNEKADSSSSAYYYSNGNVHSKINSYKSGNQKINWNSSFYEDGTLWHEYIRKNNRDSIKVEFYSNGQLRFNKIYKDGLLTGDVVYYHKNGKVKKIEKYNKNGKKNGIEYVYDDKGKVKSRQRYRDGVYNGPSIQFHENGKIAWKRFYLNGRLHGDEVSYYPNGLLRMKAFYKDGKKSKKLLSYFDNGQLKEKASFIQGKYDGQYTVYYDNGNVKDKGKYVRGKKDGVWFCYYRDGTIMAKSEYILGYRNGTRTEYDKDGRIKSRKIYREGNVVEQLGNH